MAEGQGDNNAGEAVERVTITQAATLLGCHRNTIKNRIQAGMYRAEKIHTEHGLTWMIDRNSLTNNPPTTARQQPVAGVPVVQQEALQELAKAIVREAGIAQDPEREAQLEGNKMAMEAAKALVLVGSGLLVGMAAVVGVMPAQTLSSPLLYVSFVLVILSIFCGIVWMRDIARVTMSSQGDALGGFGLAAALSFAFGLVIFGMYVLWNGPPEKPRDFLSPDTTRQQVRVVVGMLLLVGLVALVARFFRWRRQQRRSQESESPSSRG